MLKSMLVNKDFQTWDRESKFTFSDLVSDWLAAGSRQAIRNRVGKSVLINMDFNMDFT